MKKNAKMCGGAKTITCVKEEIKWGCVAWDGGPKEAGEYIVSNGDGITYKLHCSGDGDGTRDLFKGIMDHNFEDCLFAESQEELSSDDLIKLYNDNKVWYYIESHWTDCGDDQRLRICKDEDRPKYYLNTKLTGPIDNLMDVYEETITL